MKHLRSRAVAVIMTLAMALSLTGVAFAASFTDMPADDHWSHAALTAAVENNLLGGKEDNRLDPEGELTRAEMAAIIVRAFQAANEASLAGFIDVSAEEWFYADVAKANQMGVMTGDGNQMKPYDSITREEAFTVLARALKLTDGSASALNAFTDGADVSFWAVGPVAAMVEAGYVKGSDGVLSPAATITRAEFAQTMYNIFGTYLTAEGTYTEVGSGSVMINADGVTLKDVTVHGDVVIGDGVGEGDVTLDNVTVEGRVVVRGGGVNSVHILRSRVSTVVVSKVLGNVRVVGDKSSTVSTVSVTAGTETVVIENIVVTTVDVASTTPVEVKNATVTTVNVAVANANVALTSNTTVATVAVASTAVNTTVTTEAGVTVTTVSTDVAVTVTGDGKVNNTTGDGAVTDGEGNAVGTPSTPSTGTGSIGGGTSTPNPKPTDPPEEPSNPGIETPTNPTHTHNYAGSPAQFDATYHSIACVNGKVGEVDVTGCGNTKLEEHSFTDNVCACGYSKKTTVTEPTGDDAVCAGEGNDNGAHSWASTPDEAKTPTCVAGVTLTYTCQNGECGKTKTETVPATGHSYGEPDVTPATCNTAGKEVYTCDNCEVGTTGHTKEVTIAATGNHDWNDGVIKTLATCTTAGVSTFTCKTCNTTKDVTGEKNPDNHAWAETWSKDETNHWHACTNAEHTTAKKDEAKHTYNQNENTECVCGATKPVEHTPKSVVTAIDKDDTHHKMACSVAGCTNAEHEETVECTFDKENGTKCACGNTKAAEPVHNQKSVVTAIDGDNTHHKMACSVAGCTDDSHAETVECTFDKENGTQCACGNIKTTGGDVTETTCICTSKDEAGKCNAEPCTTTDCKVCHPDDTQD